MLERRKQLALVLLTIFAFQYCEATFQKLITVENDALNEESDEHYKIKFPTLKLLKPFNLFGSKKDKLIDNLEDKLENILEKKDNLEEKLEDKLELKDGGLTDLIEKKLEQWEDKKEKFDDKLLHLFDVFKDKATDKLAKKTDEKFEKKLLPPSKCEHSYAYYPAPVHYAPPPPAPLPHYKHAPPAHYKFHSRTYPSEPTHYAPHSHIYDLETVSSEEDSYAYKPIRPVYTKPTEYCADHDYEVRYFT